MELSEESGVAADSCGDSMQALKRGEALVSHEHFLRLTLKADPKISTVVASQEGTLQPAQPISAAEVKNRILNRLFAVGPAYLYAVDRRGNALDWSGNQQSAVDSMLAVATWEAMLPAGSEDYDGDVVRTDLLGDFRAGEITLFMLPGILKDCDGHGLVVYAPDPDHLGPDGRLIYTFYSSFKNIYCNEVKV